jgi:hypothetical protein
MRLVTKPVKNEFQFVGLWIISTWDIEFIANVLICLVESCIVGCKYPEDMTMRMFLMEPICELDGNLRFASTIIRRWPLKVREQRKQVLPNTPYSRKRNTALCLKAFFNLTEYILAANKLAVAGKGDHEDRFR